MICQKCKVNNATSHFHSFINGVVSDVYLCSECAKKYQNDGFGENSLYNILTSLFDTSAESQINTKKCECCNTSLAEISKTGRVGCGQCYKAFEKELEPTLIRVHGRTSHIGKKPYELSAEVSNHKEKNKNQLETLKKQLKAAIEKEEYEKAAEIRDEIKELEGKE